MQPRRAWKLPQKGMRCLAFFNVYITFHSYVGSQIGIPACFRGGSEGSVNGVIRLSYRDQVIVDERGRASPNCQGHPNRSVHALISTSVHIEDTLLGIEPLIGSDGELHQAAEFRSSINELQTDYADGTHHCECSLFDTSDVFLQ